MNQTATSIGIAIVNTVFKVSATIILAPMASFLEKMAVLTIKEKNGADDDEYEVNLLDERFLNYPPLALEQSGRAVDQMVHAAFKNLKKSTDLLKVYSQEKHDKIISREDHVDRFEDSLGAYLVRLNTKALSEKETQTAARYLSCLTNLERISDHAVNLADLGKELAEKNIHFSEQAAQELQICVAAVLEILDLTQAAMQENSPEIARKVEPLEEIIDNLTKTSKNHHVQRVQSGNCTLELGFIFNDCLSNIERVADHCSNIAVAVLESADSHIHAHGYLRTVKKGENDEYHALLASYGNKYSIEPVKTKQA